MKLMELKILLGLMAVFALSACATSNSNKPGPANPVTAGVEGTESASATDEFYDQNEDAGKKSIRQAPSADLYKRFSESMKAKQYRSANDIAAEILARNPNDVKTLTG